MNPEENNPFNNTGSTPVGDAMPGMNDLSMNDSLASAQDNLTSAGLAANNGTGIMGLDQIGASAPEAMMTPPNTEPLVPAAPVPGSIGSVTSVPPVEQPVTPEFSQPYNPFAPQPAPAAPSNNPAADAPAGPAAPAVPNAHEAPVPPAPKPAPTPAGPMAPAMPAPGMSGGMKDNLKNPLTIVSMLLAAAFLISTIVFIVLWRQAVDNPRIVYVPTVSENKPQPEERALICNRALSSEQISASGDPNIVSGENIITVNYNNDEIENLSTVTNLNYYEGYQAEAARNDAEANWPAMRELYGVTDDSMTATYINDGNLFRTEFVIDPSNQTWVGNVLTDLGVPGEDTDHTLDHVKTTAEANGYTCVTEDK